MKIAILNHFHQRGNKIAHGLFLRSPKKPHQKENPYSIRLNLEVVDEDFLNNDPMTCKNANHDLGEPIYDAEDIDELKTPTSIKLNNSSVANSCKLNNTDRFLGVNKRCSFLGESLPPSFAADPK